MRPGLTFGSRSCVRLLVAAFSLSLLWGCAGMNPNVAPAPEPAPVAAPAPPPRQTGHVVNVKKELPVRTEPSLKAKQVGKFKPGETVYVDAEQDDWYSIASTSDMAGSPLQGWVQQKFIEKDPVIIPSPPPAPSPPPQAAQGAKKDLSGMKTRTALEGLGGGAAIGAALGAIAAAATGQDIAAGAAIGAVIGGAGGLAYGTYVANQKEKYAKEEDYLEACSLEAMRYNREARATNQALVKYVAEAKQRIEVLREQIRADATNKKIAEKEAGKLQKKRAELDKMISNFEGQVNAQEKAIAGASSQSQKCTELQQNVQVTREELDKLRQQREELVNLTTKMNELTV